MHLRTAVAALAAGTLALSGAASAVAEDPVVTGFTLGTSSGRVIETSERALDQVDVVGAGLRADGRRVGVPGSDPRRLLRHAHARDLHVELLFNNYSNRIGGFDARAAHRLLASAARIDAVARRLARIVATQRWDGVNVDLELVRRRDARGLVRLVKRLQAELEPEQTVTIDVSAATSLRAYRHRGYHLGALGAAADVVVLMTYDYSGPTWSGPGPIGPLRWQRAAVRTALKRVPPERLDLGIAGYGYTWPRGRTGRAVTVRGARRLVEEDGARALWKPAYGEWRARLSDGTVLWWSDQRSYRRRVQLARDLGLHGVAVWRLGSADPLD